MTGNEARGLELRERPIALDTTDVNPAKASRPKSVLASPCSNNDFTDEARSRWNATFAIPCVSSAALSSAFGADISICDVTLGPTNSWKDCVAPGVVAAALRLGLSRIVVASSGNHGRAVAYASRAAGLQAAVLVYERTPPDIIASLKGLGAEVFCFHDRTAVHAAMDMFILDGWFSATLPDRLRNWGSMPGASGYQRIAQAIVDAVVGDPIVIVPTCYGDGATAIQHHIIMLGRSPTMCLVRASDAMGAVAASIATDVLTPQVSRMLQSGAMNVRLDDRSFLDGLKAMTAAVGKPLDGAEGGIPSALARLVEMESASPRQSVVCVLTGGVFTGLNQNQ